MQHFKGNHLSSCNFSLFVAAPRNVEADGYVTREVSDVDATAADVNMGRVGLYKMIPLG